MYLFKKLFYLIFSLLFLFSFFLIEGKYKFNLFALWSIFLLFFSFLFGKNNNSHHFNKGAKPKQIIFALILSALFIIGLFFSKQIPLSIEKLLFYLVSLAIFIFFSSIPRNELKPKIFFYYLSVLTLLLNAIVLFFTFYQDSQNVFPGMNLLVRSYGHNHYAAYLLLFIPIFWWQLLFNNDEKDVYQESKYLIIILLISSYLLIILSLARLVLVISLMQLILVFLTNKEAFASFEKNNAMKIIIKTFIFAFLSAGMIFLILSIPLNKKGDSMCPLIFDQKEICKPITKNDRFIYWQKAWLVFKENPGFGSGLKNFYSTIRYFPISNLQITSYAHNIFLHNLAEGGLLVGGFFIFFIFYLFYKSFYVMKNKKEPLYKFLWLAAFTSLLNAMFDFDWNFFIIFTLTLIFLAIILERGDYQFRLREKLLKRYFICIVIITSFFALSAFFAQILSNYRRYDLVVKYFPYMDKEIRFLIGEKKLSYNDFSSLYSFYRYDPDFLHKFSFLEKLDSDKKIALKIEHANLDPFVFVSSINFDNYNFRSALPLADKFMEIVVKYDFLNNLTFLDYWVQRNVASQFFTFANHAYADNDPELAANYYKKAIVLNEFVMEERRSFFLDSTNFSQAAIFLKFMKDLDPNLMNKYFYEYMSFYEKTLIYLFQKNQMEDFFILSEAMFAQQYNFSWFLWRDLIAVNKSAEERQRLKLVYEHFKDMTTWYDFLPTIENIRSEVAD